MILLKLELIPEEINLRLLLNFLGEMASHCFGRVPRQSGKWRNPEGGDKVLTPNSSLLTPNSLLNIHFL